MLARFGALFWNNICNTIHFIHKSLRYVFPYTHRYQLVYYPNDINTWPKIFIYYDLRGAICLLSNTTRKTIKKCSSNEVENDWYCITFVVVGNGATSYTSYAFRRQIHTALSINVNRLAGASNRNDWSKWTPLRQCS